MVFLKPLVPSPKIEAGEFTYYNDADDAALFETRNVLYSRSREADYRQVLRHCHGRQIHYVFREPPDAGLNSLPVLHLRRDLARKTAEFPPESAGAATLSSETTYGSAGKPS